MSAKLDKLTQIITPAVASLGYELWGCEYVVQANKAMLRVYLDSDDGITVDDCGRASRQINAALDVEDPISGAYDLEVSSPGLERPLFSLEQYQRYVGHKVKVKLHVPLDDRRHFSGVIVSVSDDGQIKLDLEQDGSELMDVTLAFMDIAKGHLKS